MNQPPSASSYGSSRRSPELLSQDSGLFESSRRKKPGSAILPGPVADGPSLSSLPHEKLVQLFESCRLVCAEINAKLTIARVISEAKRLVNCKKIVLYIFDTFSGSLIPVVPARGCPVDFDAEPNFRMDIDQAIVPEDSDAMVAEAFNVRRPVRRRITAEGGTESYVLSVPVWDSEGNVNAVLKLVNEAADAKSQPAEFHLEDELLMCHFILMAGVALRNAAVYKDAVHRRDLSDGLLQVLGALRPDLGVQSALLALTLQAKKIMQVDTCTIYTIDRLKNLILPVSTEGKSEDRPITIDEDFENGVGIFSRCMKGRQIIVEEFLDSGRGAAPPQRSIHAAPCMPSRKDSTPEGHNCCVVPLLSDKQVMLGFIELRNKRNEEGGHLIFSSEDIRLLEMFGRILGARLEKSEWGQRSTTQQPTEAGRAADFPSTKEGKSSFRRPSFSSLPIQEESSSDEAVDEVKDGKE